MGYAGASPTPFKLSVMAKIGTAPVLTLQTIRTVPIYIPYFFIFL